MNNQLRISLDGRIRDNVEQSIDILRQFEPAEGYYLAFSGGKDSQCVYHLAKLAGVKFDAHYSVTSVDPPELVRFIKDNYPDVEIKIPHDKDGKPITMWNLIPKHLMPPTRVVRYCCSELKESNGKYRVTLTGVRRSESVNRAKNQAMVTIQSSGGKRIKQMLDDNNIDFAVTNRHGGILLNYDNDEARNVVDLCYRTTKTLVNPIIDWTEDEVWEFLNGQGIQHCRLYDEGFKRLGCIGCPMNTNRGEQLGRWPMYRLMYLKAFTRMMAERKAKGLEAKLWKTAEDVLNWWIKL